MATNTGNEKNNSNKWETFFSKYKQDTPLNLQDLRMTPQDGFLLKDLNDLEISQNMLVHVKSLNVSDNLIPKLRLRNFENIETLDASKNMISEVILSLRKLKTLNLSYNLIPKIFDLKELPNLEKLDLSYNIIEKISLKDFITLKKNLYELDLSFNKINLEAYDFISFFEGMKNFNIKKLNIKENPFLTKNPALKNIYKVYISLCIQNIETVDGDSIKIDSSIGNLNDLTNQILMDAADLQRIEIKKKLDNDKMLFENELKKQQLSIENEMTYNHDLGTNKRITDLNENQRQSISGRDKESNLANNAIKTIIEVNESDNHETYNFLNDRNMRKSFNKSLVNLYGPKSEIYDKENLQNLSFVEKKEKQDINIIFHRIMKNLDNHYISKFDYQTLYLEIIEDLMLLIGEDYTINKTKKDYLNSNFVQMLTKLQFFIENSDEKEYTILKIIANLAFIEHGYFSKIVFDYFKSVIGSSNYKVNEIGNLVKEAIQSYLHDIINEWEGDFTILQHITDFFDNSFEINLNDIFMKNIMQFLQMFQEIWEIKYNKKSEKNDKYLNKKLPAILEKEDEDEETEELEKLQKKNLFQLKKTSIIILSKYFEIQIDNLKKKNYFMDKNNDTGEVNEDLNDELYNQQNNMIAENDQNLMNQSSQKSKLNITNKDKKSVRDYNDGNSEFKNDNNSNSNNSHIISNQSKNLENSQRLSIDDRKRKNLKTDDSKFDEILEDNRSFENKIDSEFNPQFHLTSARNEYKRHGFPKKFENQILEASDIVNKQKDIDNVKEIRSNSFKSNQEKNQVPENINNENVHLYIDNNKNYSEKENEKSIALSHHSIIKSKLNDSKIVNNKVIEEENKNIKFNNDNLLNKSINSGRGIIISEKNYSKLKEKLDNSSVSENNNFNVSINNSNNNSKLNTYLKSDKKVDKSLTAFEQKMEDNISKKSKEKDIVEMIVNKSIRNEYFKLNKSDNVNVSDDPEINFIRKESEKENIEKEKELEENEIFQKPPRLQKIEKGRLEQEFSINRSLKSESKINIKNNELSKEISKYLKNISKEIESNSETKIINKSHITNNQEDEINFKYKNKIEDQNLINNKKISLENNNLKNIDSINKDNTNLQKQQEEATPIPTTTPYMKNRISNLVKKDIISSKKNNDLVIPKNNVVFQRQKTRTEIDHWNNNYEKTICYTNGIEENYDNYKYKLNFQIFVDFYKGMILKIKEQFKDLNCIKNQEDLEIFKLFVDFSSKLFQNIKQLCKENIFDDIYDTSNESKLSKIFESENFSEFLLNMIDPIFKRYRPENSEKEDNQFDKKFESFFSDFINAKIKEEMQERLGNIGSFYNLDKNSKKSTGRTKISGSNMNKEINNLNLWNKKDKNNEIQKGNDTNLENLDKYESKFTKFELLCELKELIISIVNCVASSYRLFECGKLQQSFEKEVIKKIIFISNPKKSARIDPFMMEASCTFILVLLGDEKTKSDYTIFYNLVNKSENYSNFKSLLELINVNSKTYKDFITYIYSKINKQNAYLTDFNLDKIEGARIYVERVFQSIINIFKKLSKYMLISNPTIMRSANEILSYLRENHQFNYLSNCLKIDKDFIRLSAIKTIFYTKSDKIDFKIMDDIMLTISEYSSITEGQTELILSIVYLLFNKIIYTQVNEKDTLKHNSILNALNKAIEFMEKNLERSAPNDEEVMQKNQLSLSILLYISTIGKFYIDNEFYKNYINNSKNIERFYKILEYDYLKYNVNYYIPVEIERTMLGAKVKNYFEIPKRIKNPYTYNFLRVLMKIADILCEIPEYSMSFLIDLKAKNIIRNLDWYVNQRFLYRIFNESLPWNEFFDNIDKFIEDHISLKEFHIAKKKNLKRWQIKDEEKIKIFLLKSEEIKKMNFEIFEVVRNNKLIKQNSSIKNNNNSQEKMIKVKLKIEKIHDLLNVDTKYLSDKTKEANNNLPKLNRTINVNTQHIENKNKNKLEKTYDDIPKDKTQKSSKKEKDTNQMRKSVNIDIQDNKYPKKRKNLIMDYYAYVYEIVEKKMKKNNDAKLNKTKQLVRASKLQIQDYRNYSNLSEQIDFIVFFPGLMNYLLGKSQNSEKNINSDLYYKYDKDIQKIIQQFKTFKNVEDLKSFIMINSTNEVKVLNVRSYISMAFFDKSEKDFSKNYVKRREETSEVDLTGMREIMNTYFTHINFDKFENYKENFYKDSINFNKKNFAQYYLSKNKSTNFWKNEVLLNFEWSNIENIKRVPESESHNNPNTRSLLISSLLRCIYPILKSHSINIRKKFIEILFSDNIYYDFFHFISGGLYKKFNIGAKILNLCSSIFGTNFQFVIEFFKNNYLISANTQINEENSSKNNTQIKYSDEILKIYKKANLSDNQFKYFCKLLEIISISTIFIKKIYLMNFVESHMEYKSSFSFISLFIDCLNQLINSISNCNFPESFKDSIEILVINNLIRNNLIKNILPYTAVIMNLNKKVSKILYKKILMNSFYSQTLDIKVNLEIEENIISYLSFYKFYLEKKRRLFIETIANLRLLCNENKNLFLKEILYFNLKDSQEKINYKPSKIEDNIKNKKKLKFGEKRNNLNINNLSHKNNDNENEIQIDKKNNSNINKINNPSNKNEKSSNFNEEFVKEILEEFELSTQCNELQKIYFPEESRVFASICEVEIINEYNKTFNICILTNVNIYLFELDTKEFQNNSKLKIVKNSKYMVFNLEKILEVKYFDYNSRLIFEYEKPENITIDALLNSINKNIKFLSNEKQEISANKNDKEISKTLEDQEFKNQGFQERLNKNFNELKQEAEDLTNKKINNINTPKNTADSNPNEDNNILFSNFFGKTNLLNMFDAKDQKKYSLFFSVSFSNILDSMNYFNLIHNSNKKLKTRSNSSDSKTKFLERIILVYEKKKNENNVFKQKKEAGRENINNIMPENQDNFDDMDIPLCLEEFFQKEEFEYLKSEFKVKDSFKFNNKDNVNLILRNLKAFTISTPKSENNFNLFGNFIKDNNILFKDKKIVYLAEETFYILEENFTSFNVEDFVDYKKFSDKPDKNKIFPMILEINYSDIIEIRIDNFKLYICYSIDKSKIEKEFIFNNRYENEFFYFSIMKHLVKSLTGKEK